MALEYTIAAIQGAFASGDQAQIDEALAMVGDLDSRRMILSNQGIDPLELDDDTVLSLLLDHSRDGLE